MKNIVIITGPAGSGLSSAEFVFEELGYYVVKNAPSDSTDSIISSLAKVDHLCFVVHPRNAKNIIETLQKKKDIKLRIIVLNCDEDELLKRFSLTRHVHPRTVIEKKSPSEAIKADVEDILEIIPQADYYIDTTSLSVKNLRAKLYKFLENVEERQITSVTFISFGIKNKVPQGIDTFFDVRLIPNPYWVEELKEMTGEDQKVIDYMNSFPITKQVIDNIIHYLDFTLKEVSSSGRGSYTIGIACSGGQHRSTYVANFLADHYKEEYRTQAIHRDTASLNKDE